MPTTVPAPEASRVEIEGLITDFVSIATFKVNGQAVDGARRTVQGGTPTVLGNGIKVEVEGKLTLGTVVASTITIEKTPTSCSMEWPTPSTSPPPRSRWRASRS